jgi:hypothetical protein
MPMAAKPRRYYVVSPDNRFATGYDRPEAAETAALGFGEGAHVVDTVGTPYKPAVMMVEGGELAYVGYGSFDSRLGLDANLIEAVKKGYPPAVKAFLARGADPDATDRNGGTALIWAVARGKAEVVRQLIEAGAEVSRADPDGTTPLGLATRKNKPTLIEILRDAGAAG